MGKGLEQTFIQSLVQAGGALRWSWQASQSTRWSSIQPPRWDWDQEQNPGYLQPSGETHRFSSQLMGLISVSDPRAGVPNVWLEHLAPQGGSLSLPCDVPSSGSPAMGAGLDYITSPYQTLCGSFFTALAVGEPHCQSSDGSTRTLCGCSFDVFVGGGEPRVLLHHLDPASQSYCLTGIVSVLKRKCYGDGWWW